MGEYFRPFRRKLGRLTLAMACVFAIGWVRSVSIGDSLSWQCQKTVVIGFGSNSQSITVVRIIDPDEEWDPALVYPEWLSAPAARMFTVEMEEDPEFGLRWSRWGPFGIGTANDGKSEALALTAPYWSIVMPLTAISAYLLLSKPRQKTKPVA